MLDALENIPVPRPKRFYWISVLVTIFTVSVFWIGFNCQWGRLYAPFSYHRLQVEALLAGRISLSSSIEKTEHGLTWHNGQVNQVWGLGVALWMIPFELLWRPFSDSPCPDRVPLLAAFCLFAWYASRSGIVVANAIQSKIAGFSFVILVVLFPPLWNLVLGRQSISEETILYATLASIGILLGVLRFLLLRQTVDLLIVCFLGGLSALIRVTHGIYGLMGGLICLFVVVHTVRHSSYAPERSQRSIPLFGIIAGFSMLCAGFLLLAYSNALRYGSVLECGHRITNHFTDVIYLTRFGNPFAQAGIVDAAQELFSWMFLSPWHTKGSAWNHGLPLQAPAGRWRSVEQATFDPTYLVFALLGCLVCCLWRFRPNRFRLDQIKQSTRFTVETLLAWLVFTALGLTLFYFYAPILATRYILDYAPAFLAPFIMMCLLLGRHWPRLLLTLSLVWTCAETGALWLSAPSVPVALSRDEISSAASPAGVPLSSFNGEYSPRSLPGATKIWYNGQGWSGDGMVPPVLTLAIDNPDFLEIWVESSAKLEESPDIYRAKIGILELPILSISSTNRNIKTVKFNIPPELRHQEHLVYLCFVSDWERDQRESRRRLLLVRWK